MIATDRLKAKFEQAIRSLPDVPAKTGEPWERTELLEINGKRIHASEEVRVSRHREEGRQNPGENQLQGAGDQSTTRIQIQSCL